MGQSRNERMKQKSKYSWGSRMVLIGITVVVLSLAVVTNLGAASLREKDLEYQAKEAELQKTLDSENARAAQLEEFRVYVQTKQYVEKIAKEKLGLVNKDEILLKPKESK